MPKVKDLVGTTLSWLSTLIPKRSLVALASRDGYSANAKAAYLALEEAGFPFGRVIWLAKDEAQATSLRARGFDCHVLGSVKAAWTTARSRWLVSTHGELGRFRAAKGQQYVNLWHGSGMKLSGYLWREEDGHFHRKTAGRATITLVTSEFMRVAWSAICCMRADRVFVTGYPRNDVLHDQEGARARLSTFLGAGDFDRLILYAPTHRKVHDQEHAVEESSWTLHDFLERYLRPELREALANTRTLLVVKLHPMDEPLFAGALSAGEGNIRLLLQEELDHEDFDLYGLMAGFDMLWTDYSSMATDYLLTEKPVLFFVDDLEEYKRGRGVIFDDFDFFTPGPKIQSLDGLLEAWPRLLEDEGFFAAERASFLKRMHGAPRPYSQNLLKAMHELQSAPVRASASRTEEILS